jgi:hypothetical protein
MEAVDYPIRHRVFQVLQTIRLLDGTQCRYNPELKSIQPSGAKKVHVSHIMLKGSADLRFERLCASYFFEE